MKEMTNSDIDYVKQLKDVLYPENLSASEQEIEEEISRVIWKDVEENSKMLLEKFKKEMSEQTKKIIDYEKGFNERLLERWKIPIENLTYFIHRNITEGKQFNSEERPSASNNDDYRFEALIRIHGQSCLIALEALCLLKYGFADGANARWRTLFENSIYLMFISDNDQYTSKRFLDYSVVEEYKLATSDPLIKDEDLKRLKDRLDKLEIQYGASFTSKNGWYAHIIPKNRERNLNSIMRLVEMKHMNYWYKLACVKVHSGSDSLYQNLGLLNHSNQILAGPSNFGLSIPGQNIAISLAQTTNTMLLSVPNKERLYIGKSIVEYAQIIQDQFIKCQDDLISDEMNIQRDTT